VAGDGGPLGRTETAHYTDIAAANAVSMIKRVKQGDIVLLHDPQTAAMAAPLAEAGAVVVWRCHVGRETTNEWTDQAWEFLRHHVDQCEAFVFSLRSYVPSWIDPSSAWVIPPSIDPFSPKNQLLAKDDLMRILRRIGLLQRGNDEFLGTFIRRNGTAGTVERRASILSFDQSPLDPGVPLVTQVSRWDRLKDMSGVMAGFASHVAGRVDAHLALVGPSIGDVTDDPEEAEVFAECVSAWHDLTERARRRVTLVTLPMDDIDENAAMVNALQCHSTAIVQKSLEEGFGLTVAEAMWKAKAVVASNVGGIAEQIAPGTGILLEDPRDLDAFGRTLAQLLRHPEEIAELGTQARRHVREGFLGDKHLIRYANLMETLANG
jgi:trehalose synthase